MSSGLEDPQSSGGKYRRSTTFDLVFPTMPSLQKTAQNIDLYQKQGNHDILVVKFSTTGQTWFDSIPTGLPVHFSWSQSGITKNWYGYVSYVSKVVTSRDDKTMEVHCVGSSFPLKERVNRVFTNCTIPEAASIIALEHGFNFIGDPHGRRFSQLTIAGHSYWEWLQEQAHRIGFALVVDGVNLMFRDLDKLIDQNANSIAVLDLGNNETTSGKQIIDRTLDYFKVLKGEYIEDSNSFRTIKNMAGVDPFTSSSVSSSSSPNSVGINLRASVSDVLFSEYRSDQVIDSSQNADLISQGAAQLARMNLPAKIMGQGDSKIKPYAPVLVRGTGELTDGYWLVKEVVHSFEKFGRYSTEVLVVTDGTGENVATNFRQKIPSEVAKVNISEALARGSSVASLLENSEPVLTQYSPSVLPNTQGFNRSPALWVSTQPQKG